LDGCDIALEQLKSLQSLSECHYLPRIYVNY
jgi:hypothetical protein